MENLEQKAVELLNRFDDLITQYSPEVIDTAMDVIFVTAAGKLIEAVVLLMCTFLSYKISIKFIKWVKVKFDEEDIEAIITTIYLLLIIIMLLIFMFTSMSYLLDTWNWVAIFNPKLALAHKVLGF